MLPFVAPAARQYCLHAVMGCHLFSKSIAINQIKIIGILYIAFLNDNIRISLIIELDHKTPTKKLIQNKKGL
jgi:hypothetical protein